MAAGLALASTLVGCKQQCFLHECDYKHYSTLGIPAHLDTDAAAASIRPMAHDVPPPPTVLNPEREPRHLSLAEAIAMALEHGTVGSPSTANPGLASDALATAGPQARTNVTLGNDNIRVLALDPAITSTDMEASQAKFDARWVSSLTWNTTDRPVGSALDTFQARGQVNAINTQDASALTSLVKPLPTGGVAGITFRTDYSLSNLNPRVNPSYRPSIQFGFEQPLLQGFGVDINQLRSTHPGVVLSQLSGLTPFSTGGRVEGILITRIRFDIQRAEFERNVNIMLLNVEAAYWNLYSAYWTLYSREQALRQAYEAWKINKARYEAGRIAITEFAQTRVQYELFRSQRIEALGQVLDREIQLRGLLGLQVNDGTRLVPADAPNLAPYQPDWSLAVQEALALRPELVMARHDLKARQLDIINQKNLMLPDIRFGAQYDINAIGTRLDGPDGALSELAGMKFVNYGFGLRGEIPLGYRDAHSALRATRLNLARTLLALQDQEEKAVRSLSVQYQRIFEFHEQIKAQRAQREAAAQQLEARFREFLAGRGTLDILLEAQRFWAEALRQEYNFIGQYNIALAGFEFAKGTIQQHNNVVISEGPLPQCAQVRAVEHERERSKALVLRERANPVAVCGGTETGCPSLPALPPAGAPSIPAAMEGLKLAPPVPDRLPPGPDAEHLKASKAAVPAALTPAPVLVSPVVTPPAKQEPIPARKPATDDTTKTLPEAPKPAQLPPSGPVIPTLPPQPGQQ